MVQASKTNPTMLKEKFRMGHSKVDSHMAADAFITQPAATGWPQRFLMTTYTLP